MSYIYDKWRLWKLKREQRSLRKDYAKKFAQLKKSKTRTPDDYNELAASEYFDERLMDDEIGTFLSDRLREQATDCDVEIPSMSDNPELWQHTETGGSSYLSLRGREVMRERISQARERNSADWSRRSKIWVPIISAIAAVLSAATAFILAFKK